MKIFYHPETLKIMGGSDGPVSMEFPYIETPETYHSFENLKIEEKNGKKKLKVVKGTLSSEEIRNIFKPRKRN